MFGVANQGRASCLNPGRLPKKQHKSCGDKIDETCFPLYPLSYSPTVMELAGIEPATWGFGSCSSTGIRRISNRCTLPKKIKKQRQG
jgi:hypothetical protein